MLAKTIAGIQERAIIHKLVNVSGVRKAAATMIKGITAQYKAVGI